MKKLQKREKLLIGVLGVLVIFYAYYAFYLGPMVIQIKASKSSISKSNSDINRIRNAETLIKNQKEEINTLENRLKAATDAIPGMEKNPEIAYDLKQIGSASNIEVTNISIGKPSGVNTIQSEQQKNDQTGSGSKKDGTLDNLMLIPVTITAVGNYSSLMSFIEALENGKRLVQIEQLNMSASGQNGSTNLNVIVSYYYFSDGNTGEIQYDFNKGTFGKNDIFN